MPVGFLEDVITVRRFVDAYYANERDPKGWDSSPLRRLVQEMEAEDAAQEAAGG